MQMGRIITVGEIMLRLSPYRHNRLLQNDQLKATFGGAEANVAVSLANYGESVSFVTKVPANQIGKSAVNDLRYYGVDTSYIVKGGDRLGIYYMEPGVDHRRSLCIYDRKGSSFSQAKEEEFSWDEIFRDAVWFHFSGITPALGKNTIILCKKACIEAKKRNITISCDLNYRSMLWSKDDAKTVMSNLCTYVDVLISNEEDAYSVFDIEPENTDIKRGIINKKEYEQITRELLKKYNFSAIAFTFRKSYSATINKWSGMFFNEGQFYYSKEYTIENIVDRVGSGDSFAAGLIYGLMKEFTGQKTIEFAVAASALKHGIEGDYNRVNVDDVDRLLNGDYSGRIER